MRLIDADELKTAFPCGEYVRTESVRATIDSMPTIEAEPIRHGKWIHNGFMEVKCNNCGNVFHELEDTNYCPNCGAKMDEVNDEAKDT